jgi:thiol-disulfide isomerase/thioredoxin
MSKIEAYHFWSTTCAPCNAIKPLMADLKEEFDGKLTWISVNVQQDSNNFREAFKVTSWPTVVVVVKDATGNVVYTDRHSGTAAAGYYRIIRNALRLTSQ